MLINVLHIFMTWFWLLMRCEKIILSRICFRVKGGRFYVVLSYPIPCILEFQIIGSYSVRFFLPTRRCMGVPRSTYSYFNRKRAFGRWNWSLTCLHVAMSAHCRLWAYIGVLVLLTSFYWRNRRASPHYWKGRGPRKYHTLWIRILYFNFYEIKLLKKTQPIIYPAKKKKDT